MARSSWILPTLSLLSAFAWWSGVVPMLRDATVILLTCSLTALVLRWVDSEA